MTKKKKALIIGIFILGLYLLYLWLSKVNIFMKTQKHVNCSIVERKYLIVTSFAIGREFPWF